MSRTDEDRMWLDIKRHIVPKAIDDTVSDEQLGRLLRSYMNLPASPPFTGDKHD
jgi:hypothetical protein